MGFFQDLGGALETLLHIGHPKGNAVQLAQTDINAVVSVGGNFLSIGQEFVTVLQAILKPYPAAAGLIGILTAALGAAESVIGIIKSLTPAAVPPATASPPAAPAPAS